MPQSRLHVNWIPTGETLKNVFVEEWIDVCGDSSDGQKTTNAPVRVTTMAHDDETPAGQINFSQNSIEALHRLRSCPGRGNVECRLVTDGDLSYQSHKWIQTYTREKCTSKRTAEL